MSLCYCGNTEAYVGATPTAVACPNPACRFYEGPPQPKEVSGPPIVCPFCQGPARYVKLPTGQVIPGCRMLGCRIYVAAS